MNFLGLFCMVLVLVLYGLYLEAPKFAVLDGPIL